MPSYPAPRTSSSHPLQIAELGIGSEGGAIGVTFAPGKKQLSAMTGAWARDLDTDLAVISSWGATVLISLIEPWEFDELEIQALPEKAKAHGLEWHGLPIVDGDVPTQEWLKRWSDVGQQILGRVMAGGRVVIHCKGGLGRAGTVASMLLLQSDEYTDPDKVMAAVRRVRPGAIETVTQEEFLRDWASKCIRMQAKPDAT